MKPASWLAIVAVTAAPAVAGAQEVRLTSTTDVSWHADNDNQDLYDDGYGALLERLFATGTDGPWVLGAQLDLTGFVSTPTSAEDVPALDSRYQGTLNPEKMWLTWQGRDLEVVAGDSHVAFGRGLGLTLRQVDDLGVNTTLLGGKAMWRRGDLEATAAAGLTNISNVDLASGRTADDPHDLAAGAQVLVRTHGLRVGGHAETIAFWRPLAFIPEGMEEPRWADRWIMAGPILDAPRLAPKVGLYAEAVVQDRGDARGFGGYATATWFRSPTTTVMFEGKAYGDLAVVQPRFEDSQVEFATVQYTTPPTAERLLEPLEHPQQQTYGARSRIDWRARDRLLVYANYGLFRDHVGYLTEVDMSAEMRPGTVHDPYAGAEYSWDAERSRAGLSAGTRLVVADSSGQLVRQNLHVEYDLVRALGPRLSAQLHGYHMRRGKDAPPFIHERWNEGTLGLGMSWAGRFVITGVLDYTTEMLAPRSTYLGAVLEWKPTARAAASLFAGGTRGGLKCVSGVCRELPPFEGARLSLILHY